jgi:endo-1,4-beta-xylanase
MVGQDMTAPLKAGENSLREAAAQRNLRYGTALATSDISWEPYCRRIVRDCNFITPEYEMKWDAISGLSGEPDYGACDRLVAFATSNNLAVHGHAVWWHGSVPASLRGSAGEPFARAALQHLERTVARYAGRLSSWDVVNEPLDPDHGRSDGLRSSPFLDAFGPGYVGKAFRRAAAIDPEAILVLNEMGLEYASPEAERKRRRMIALLERELAGGAPIHCLGIQSHLDAADQPRDHRELRAFLREIDRLGLSVMITEMDVSDVRCTGDRQQRDRMVADAYRTYIELVLAESKVLSVCTWGLSDARSWLHSHQRRGDGSPLRPLPRDRALRRKPAWHAIRAALQSPRRDASTPGSAG